MKKWISRILLIILLITAGWIGYIYNCAYQSINYNVVIETEGHGIFRIGSGVIISDDGVILTAGHVLEDAERVKITLPNGQKWIAEKFYIDPNVDVGFIDLPIETPEYIELSDSNTIEKYDFIYNIGNSLGIWDDSIFLGIVYKNHFTRMFLGESNEYILAIMNIQSGCSGGGVYHYNNLIGIVVMKGDGATFIIPSNICKGVYGKTGY